MRNPSPPKPAFDQGGFEVAHRLTAESALGRVKKFEVFPEDFVALILLQLHAALIP